MNMLVQLLYSLRQGFLNFFCAMEPFESLMKTTGLLYAFFCIIPWCLNFICRFGTLFHFHTYLSMKTEQSVPKCWHIKFRRWGITQKAYNVQNMAKAWNQEYWPLLTKNVFKYIK